MTELFALLIKLKQSDDRVQVTGERWKQKDGLSPNPSAREGNSYNRKKGT